MYIFGIKIKSVTFYYQIGNINISISFYSLSTKQLIYVPIRKRVGLVESLFDIRDMFNRNFNSFNNPTYKLLSHKSFICPNLKKALAHYLYTRITLY